VQSWLNEFRGEKGMTKELAAKNVEGGEPAGLRQVSSIIDATKFYTGYLVHWKVDAKFVKLLASLEQSVASTQTSKAAFEEALKQLQDKLAAGIEAHKAATAAVKAALDSKEIEEGKLAEATDDYNALVAEQKALEDKLAALEDAVAAAQAAYDAAVAALQSSHAEATAFLQMLQANGAQDPSSFLKVARRHVA
jgi:DNA repair protein RecN (Recombination protein N)